MRLIIFKKKKFRFENLKIPTRTVVQVIDVAGGFFVEIAVRFEIISFYYEFISTFIY